MENPEFLKNKYKDLADSKEVQEAARKERAHRTRKTKRDEGVEELGDTPEALIQNYLSRIEKALARHGKMALPKIKQDLHDRFVMKPEDVPESYFSSIIRKHKEEGHGSIEIPKNEKAELIDTAINDQKKSLDTWIDYFASPDAKYPDYLKYWALRSVVKMGRYDKEKKKFTERSIGGAVSAFPELNREALALVFSAVERKHQGQQPDFGYDISEEIKKSFLTFLEKENFSKLYAVAIEEFKPISEELLQVTEGQWVKYPRGSDPKPLVDSLANYGTGWCIRGEATAKRYLQGQGQYDKGSDLEVFYSHDQDKKPKVPRVVIVRNGGRTTEVRGIAKQENLDEYIGAVVDAKLSQLPDGKAYSKKASDMKKLTGIEKKMKAQEILDAEELKFLYEIDAPIDGFGYQKDPRIKELIDQRNKKADAPVVLECSADEIAWKKEDVNNNTKAYIGDLFDGFFDKLPKSITHVYTTFPEGNVWDEKIDVDYNRPWGKSVAAGEYNWVSPDFTEARFPIRRTEESLEAIIPRELVMIQMKGNPTTEQILEEMKRLGLEPAKTEDLLRVGELYKELQRKFWIVALGSSAPSSIGRTVVPVLSENVGGRELRLGGYDGRWRGNSRFLARRKL